jgi:hypothetical protein
MTRITDHRLTTDEIESLSSPYVTAMRAIFAAAEQRTMEVVEKMAAAGATEAEILKAVDALFQ